MDDATLTELGAALRADFADWQRQHDAWLAPAGAWPQPEELARLEELALELAGQADELAALHGWLTGGWPGAPPPAEPGAGAPWAVAGAAASDPPP
ncbi:MAG TPA: hypothetical protein VGE07_05795, partial [Herpetosiphonaceae bacterium]